MKISFLFIFFLIAATIFAYLPESKDHVEAFQIFKKKFNRNYHPLEEQHRLQIFKKKLERIHEHNSNPKNTFKIGINKFSDLSNEEYIATYTTNYDHNQVKHKANTISKDNGFVTLPNSVDNRGTHCVEIKDQSSCGSCWTFGANAFFEGALYDNYGILVELSEQQTLSCTYKDPGDGYISVPTSWGTYTGGCDGGSMYHVEELNQKYLASVSSKNYPYVATDGTCMKGYDKIFRINDDEEIGDVEGISETELKQLISRHGVVGILISASNDDFMDYHSGVFNSQKCNGGLDHAVSLVGYGMDGDYAYWILRNSYGNTWGVNGYMYLARGISQSGTSSFPYGMCGVRSSIYFLKNQPTTSLKKMELIQNFKCEDQVGKWTCTFNETSDANLYKIYWHQSDIDNISEDTVECSDGVCEYTRTEDDLTGLQFAARSFIDDDDFLQYGQRTYWYQIGTDLPPFYYGPLLDQILEAEDEFEYTFGEDVFVDPEGQELSYSANQEDSDTLPDWLSYDGQRKFHGTAPDKNATFVIQVKAKDPNDNEIVKEFTIEIQKSFGYRIASCGLWILLVFSMFVFW
ncbi:cysteine protease [Anaeramoeba flamelloides]|uniref:Cysteine protease n=1 Tax=Anaeramoeba flamelloides TaxID=1746091 RepID=A0AAV8ACQ8_9EUKA|nr:cysteine protease [Anaeramoeba flamelloides]